MKFCHVEVRIINRGDKMSINQREACDLINKIDDCELPRVISILQIFAKESYATTEELKAIKNHFYLLILPVMIHLFLCR